MWRFTLVSIQVIARALATADFRIVSGWAGSGEDESCPRYGKSAVQHADQRCKDLGAGFIWEGLEGWGGEGIGMGWWEEWSEGERKSERVEEEEERLREREVG